MTPDEARKELRLFFKHEWHDYIDNTLAGDFAGELAVKMREHHDMQTDMALCAEFEAFANARISELEGKLEESKGRVKALTSSRERLVNWLRGTREYIIKLEDAEIRLEKALTVISGWPSLWCKECGWTGKEKDAVWPEGCPEYPHDVDPICPNCKEAGSGYGVRLDEFDPQEYAKETLKAGANNA